MIRNRMQGNKFTTASLDKWHDWHWQMRHAVKDIGMVEKIFDRTFEPEMRSKIEQTLEKFPMSITPYYLSLVDADDLENDPVFKQAFPDVRELHISSHDMNDPLAEDRDSPVPGLTHRYPDRVLLHVSNTCAMYCRHCTRKRKVGDRDNIPCRDQILAGIEYIRNNPAIRDVLLSGGDPFMLSDEYIDWILAEVTAIEHVEVVRIGTRTPVVLPYRITDELVAVLEKYESLWINTHFNHPRELTGSARKA
ncbi:MAG: KamA family radical SAM protein, partial [Clostridiaceae bacterium]|nr:KamA family radical SAM protein [Clostridiaceae bacterium]